MKTYIDQEPIEREMYTGTLIMTFAEFAQYVTENESMKLQWELLRRYFTDKFFTPINKPGDFETIQYQPGIRIETHNFWSYISVSVCIMGFVGRVICKDGILIDPEIILESEI